MRLISCDVENFGCLSNFHMDFNEGCNIVHHENGWGKSTLAGFLRIMFYGFENSGKRDDYENERRRYVPWQGGVYGGKITFEAGDKKYCFSRTFGNKEIDDTFYIRDLDTNLETNDFDSNIGIELFNLDSGSFLRSIFISQNDCETRITDGINAKLGNVAENTDDVNNYEKVDAKFKDMLNKMSPRRTTGSINRLKNDITQLEIELNLLPQKEASIKENQELLDKTRNTIAESYAEIEKIKEQIDGINARIKLNQEQRNMFRLTETEEAELNRLSERFAIEMPEEEILMGLKENWIIRLGKIESLKSSKIYLANEENAFLNRPIKKPPFIPMWIVSAVVLILSIVTLVIPAVKGVIGIIGIVVAIALFVTGLLLKNKKAGPETEPLGITMLRNEIEATEKAIFETEEKVKKYIVRFGYDYNVETVSFDLEKISRDVAKFKELTEKHSNSKKHNDSDYVNQKNLISSLEVKKGAIQNQCDKLHSNINQYKLNISRLEDEYDSIFEKQEVLFEMKKQYEKDIKKYELINKTKDILGEAKIAFSQKFMKPITEGFNKYRSIIAEIDSTVYIIDAKGEISIEDKGTNHDKKFMSTGYRDLIGICIRMALVDAMFKEEKPFLIFDDPFINMDENKIKGGADFIQNISKEYQVVYFTCHDSRII